jgi:hypothetical protein
MFDVSKTDEYFIQFIIHGGMDGSPRGIYFNCPLCDRKAVKTSLPDVGDLEEAFIGISESNIKPKWGQFTCTSCNAIFGFIRMDPPSLLVFGHDGFERL